DSFIDGRMPRDVRRIVGESAQREGVLVHIPAFEQKLAHEVAAAYVVHQITELRAAERIVAEILDDGAPIRIGVRLPDLILRQSRKSREQQGTDLIRPEQIYDFLVS